MLSPVHQILCKSEYQLHNQNSVNANGYELHQTLVTACVADCAHLLTAERTRISRKVV